MAMLMGHDVTERPLDKTMRCGPLERLGATDLVGKATTATASCVVPPDQGKKK